MAITYIPLATTTLGSNQSSFSFSSISSEYTDLIIVGDVTTTSSGVDMYMRFNGSSSGYSVQWLGSNGSAVYAAHLSGQSQARLNYGVDVSSLNGTMFILNILNYANTSMYKTFWNRTGKADDSVEISIGVWESTVAINEITLLPSSLSWATGSIFSLYGIKAA